MRLLSVIMLALLPFPAQDLLEGKTLLEREAEVLNVTSAISTRRTSRRK